MHKNPLYTVFITILKRDLYFGMRRSGELANSLIFFLIVVTMFPFALGTESALLRDIYPGVIWVAALLSVTMSLDRMFNSDFEDGTLEQIIAATENGLLLESPKSWSIGSNRENFHFATQIGWKIIDGKIDHVVRNPTYGQGSLPFWNSLDKVGDASTWQLQQVFNCGKGQPNQVMRLGHGIPVCRFKNVQVGR